VLANAFRIRGLFPSPKRFEQSLFSRNAENQHA